MTDSTTPVPPDADLAELQIAVTGEGMKVLVDRPVIVDGDCGKTPTSVIDEAQQADIIVPRRRLPVLSTISLVDAVRRPLVTYTDGGGDAWAAKLQADTPTPRKRERRIGSTLLAAACVLFLMAFVGGREAAVAAVPDLAGLYAVLGLPVNLYGLEIKGVEAERRPARKGAAAVLVRGVIVNVSRQAQPIPPLRIGFTSGDTVVGATEVDPPAKVVKVGAAVPFEVELAAPPADAAQVVVRFAAAPSGAVTALDGATPR